MNQERISPERRTVVARQTERTNGLRSGARLLARLELGQTWPSYLTATLGASFLGLLAGSFLRAGSGDAYDGVGPTGFFLGGGGPMDFFLDGMFLLWLANLGINWTSTNWFYVHTDPFTPRLSFLRALPVPVRDLVLSRLMLALATTMVTSLAFFVPSYALFSLRTDIPPAQFLWFALFWIGYVLFSTGILLFLEMGVKGVWALVGCLAWATLLLMIVVLAQVVGVPLVGGSLWLTREHGPLVAVPALAAGGVGLLLWCWFLERRLRTRELVS